jgi:hypothetical protein
MRETAIALIAAVALFLFAAGASAQGTLPPDSAVDEYVEGLPGPTGSVPSNKVDKDKGERRDLPPAVTRSLEALGEDGEAAADLAAATAPPTEGVGRNKGNGSKATGEGEAGSSSEDSGESGIAAVVGQAIGGSDEGMGLLFPLLLVVSALGGVAVWAVRKSRQGARGDG